MVLAVCLCDAFA
ncbi:hypothetical protein O1D87_003456 [Vibrio cholerae]|nr:hypothetical protein [Vibrio cholerae]EGQ9392389.1 hypothetical protein [Vibrio cholerae]EGR0539775.1 hypothetical protein [Vibrio cholerae]EGR1860835.1 hypothetical protein [Vibrio cholerae]EGR2312185.1 hypothetical protein [Vibrio cholerae]